MASIVQIRKAKLLARRRRSAFDNPGSEIVGTRRDVYVVLTLAGVPNESHRRRAARLFDSVFASIILGPLHLPRAQPGRFNPSKDT